ncbi:MAG: N-acetyltransferase protein [Pseudomonadota bacterium]|jgi:PhzF family phenazine biosynthesis protein|nr:N-acetyltransferase protein [Pseudomonadota bacterium]
MSIILRKTTAADLDFVSAAESHPDNCNYVYQWSPVEHLAALSDPNLAHYVIEDSHTHEFLGYIILDEVQNSSHSINLRRLVVTVKNRGIGRLALEAIKQIAFEELAAHRLWLDVFSDNLRAYQLYQKVGFIQEGLLRESYLRNGVYASQYLMAILSTEYFVMRQHLLRCFGTTAETGNCALVVEQHNFSPAQKQAFATTQNLPVCVFIDNNSATNFSVDFYYPHRQSPLCLHGSLAAARMFFNFYPDLNQAVLLTAAGQRIKIHQHNSQISLAVTPQVVVDKSFSHSEIAQLLGINLTQIKSIQLASVGSPKLLVELNSVANLFALKPDLHAIVAWGKLNAINGIYAYYRESASVTGRNFNHLDARVEDSATGVAAGALCLALQMDLEVYQGQNLNNPCLIQASYSASEISLSGRIYLDE